MGGGQTSRPEPFVGPRAFVAGERLYGRDREVQDLLDLLIAERVVLLHAPSGAGKSSLLQAALLPRLRGEGFKSLPLVRVGHDPPAGAPAGVNRYVLSALLDLADEGDTLAELAGRSLAGEVQRRRAAAGDDECVLIVDQFEEIVTVDPIDRAGKLEFFKQLGEALRDPRVWAVLALREDWLAALAPYRDLVPTRLRTTFRLDLLAPAAALHAIQEPARAAGVPFTDAAARKLVDDLRAVKVVGAEGVAIVPGLVVEPVQLQVVCRSLWDRLPAGQATIDVDDVQRLGDVDQALAAYCDAAVAAAASSSGAPERALRGWLQRHLVTEAGLRSQVLRTTGPADETLGLTNRALGSLIDAHLLRADERRGMMWIELAHDRLVAPLVASNAAWFRGNLRPLQRQADLWDSQGRREDLLAADPEAAAAELGGAALTAIEDEFLNRSRVVRGREAQIKRLRRWSIGLLVIAFVGVAGLAEVRRLAEGRAVAERDRADAAAHVAEVAARQALVRQLAAQSALQPIGRADVAARLALAAGALAGTDAERRGLLIDHWARFPGLAQIWPYGQVSAMAADRGFARMVTLDDGWDVGVRDLRTGAAIGASIGTAGAVAIDPAGTIAVWGPPAGGGADLTVWDIGTGAVRAVLRQPAGFTGKVEGLRIADDGARVIARSRTGSFAVWRIDPPELLANLQSEANNVVLAVDLHPGGERIAVGHRLGQLAVLDLAGEVLARDTSDVGSVLAVRFDPGGERLFVVRNPTGEVSEWKVATDGLEQIRGRVLDRETLLEEVVFAPDVGTVAALHCGDPCSFQELGVWDLADGRLLASEALPLENLERRPAFVGAGLVALGSGDGTVRVWEPGRRPMLTMPRLASVAVRPDGGQVATGGCDAVTRGSGPCEGGEIRLWDPSTGQRDGDALGPVGDQVVGVQYAADGRTLVAVDRRGGVTTWDLATRASRRGELPRSDGVLAGAGGEVVAAIVGETSIALWDVIAGKAREAVFPIAGRVVAVALAADASMLAAAVCPTEACAAAEVIVWSTRDAAVRRRFTTGSVVALAFAPAGDRLATSEGDATVRVWGLGGGEDFELAAELERLVAVDLAFSGDGERLATIACRDPKCEDSGSVLMLWSLAERRALTDPIHGHSGLYAAHDGSRRRVLFAGEVLLSASHDGVRVWDLREAVLRARVCALAGRELDADEWARRVGVAAQRTICGGP